MDDLKVHHQPFLDTCLMLLDTYTAGQLPRLRFLLADNQRNCSNYATIHGLELPDEHVRDALDVFVLALDRAVRFALRRGTKPLLNPGHAMKGFSKTRRHWPTSLEQLFPQGSARGVDVLVHWCCTSLSHQQFATLASFVFVVPDEVIPRLLEHPRRERLCWAFLQALHPSAFPWHGSVPFAMPPGMRVAGGVRGQEETVKMVVVTMHMIMHARKDEDDGVRVYAGYEALFLSVLENVSSRIHVGSDSTPLMSLRGCIAFFRGRLGLGGRADHLLDDYAVLRGGICKALSTYALEPRCGNLECGATGSPRAGGRALRKCSCCNFVRYCSPECQKQDWRRGTAEHVPVCPLMGRVTARLNNFANYDGLEAAFAACAFGSGELDILGKWIKKLSDRGIIPISIGELVSLTN